jgi:hypothetical protein
MDELGGLTPACPFELPAQLPCLLAEIPGGEEL